VIATLQICRNLLCFGGLWPIGGIQDKARFSKALCALKSLKGKLAAHNK
jgi:hypothetical protein